jgi:hypothetical protein
LSREAGCSLWRARSGGRRRATRRAGGACDLRRGLLRGPRRRLWRRRRRRRRRVSRLRPTRRIGDVGALARAVSHTLAVTVEEHPRTNDAKRPSREGEGTPYSMQSPDLQEKKNPIQKPQFAPRVAGTPYMQSPESRAGGGVSHTLAVTTNTRGRMMCETANNNNN